MSNAMSGVWLSKLNVLLMMIVPPFLVCVMVKMNRFFRGIVLGGLGGRGVTIHFIATDPLEYDNWDTKIRVQKPDIIQNQGTVKYAK